MAKLVITSPARRDLKEIFKEISRKGYPETARNYVRKLREKCHIVAQNPKAFRERKDISEGLHVFPVDNYSYSVSNQRQNRGSYTDHPCLPGYYERFGLMVVLGTPAGVAEWR